MKTPLLKELPELVQAGIIPQETADKISDYYLNQRTPSQNRIVIAFGILGAILVGLGIILIIAHNWDEFPRMVKTGFAFLPLVAGQIVCGFTLMKKRGSIAWVESATAFLFFAVGASISLVSQVYNIPGNLTSFLFTWMLLCLPLIYVMNSSIASLLYLIGITYYACESGYWSHPATESYWYWILLLLALPHFVRLHRKQPEGNFMIFHNWLVPLSLLTALGTVAESTEELMFIAYMSLLGLFYLFGSSEFFSEQKRRSNGFFIISSVGTIGMLLAFSFDWFWKMLARSNLRYREVVSSPEFYASAIITLVALGFLFRQMKNQPLREIKPLGVVFLVFIVTFIMGLSSITLPLIIINLLALAIGVLTIRSGAQADHLGILNFGLLIITALVVCRYFDSDLSFVAKGILFVSVGLGFFFSNYLMLKKRKAHE